MNSLLSVISIYSGLLPCAVYFLMMFREQIKAEKLLVVHALLSLFFFCVFQLSKAVLPAFSAFFLSAAITLLSLSAIYHKLFKIDYLHSFPHLSMVTAVSFLMHSLFSYFNAEGSHFFSGKVVSLLCGLFTSLVLLFYLIGIRQLVLRKNASNIWQMPLVPLIVILTDANCLLYLMNPAGISGYFPPGFIMITLLCTAVFFYAVHEEKRLEKHLNTFDLDELLQRQLPFLKQQISLLETAETAVHQYKKQADLSCSVDDAFAKNRTYLMSLYTDDLVFNTFFAYYADIFEQSGIDYSFSISCSTCLPFSESLLLFLLYGLLETTEEAAFLSFSMHLNIYTLRFKTERKRKNDLIFLIQRFRLIAEPLEILDTITDSESVCQAEIHMIIRCNNENHGSFFTVRE